MMARRIEKKDRTAPRRRPGAEPVGARIAFGPTNYALFGAAVLSIVAGYVLLGRGSITLAPILLILGYVVLLPAGLLVRRDFRGD